MDETVVEPLEGIMIPQCFLDYLQSSFKDMSELTNDRYLLG